MSNKNKYDLYMRAFTRTLGSYGHGQSIRDTLKKAIVYGVKAINTQPKETLVLKDDYIERFQLISTIHYFMGILTPMEFMNLFPITKEYDGQKYEWKDYFYTMDYIKTLDPDKPIAPIGQDDKILHFLWEYRNIEIERFTVNGMTCLSALREFEGQPSLMEEWAADKGIKTYTMHEDNQGNKFMLDNETGKTTKVLKPKPKHLKLVK